MRFGKLVEPPAKLLLELHCLVGRGRRFGDLFHAPRLSHRFIVATQNRLPRQMLPCPLAAHVDCLAPDQHGQDLPQVVPVAEPGKAAFAEPFKEGPDRHLGHVLFVCEPMGSPSQSCPRQTHQALDVTLIDSLGGLLVRMALELLDQH